MDEKGFAQFASVANVAHRARVTLDEAQVALTCFESPDIDSSDPENEGKRVERVPGGWMILNAEKHRELVTRSVIQEQTRERVRRFRERLKRNSNAPVTTSEVRSEVLVKEEREIAHSNGNGKVTEVTLKPRRDEQWLAFQQAYPGTKRSGGYMENQAFLAACDEITGGFPALLAKLEEHKKSKDWREGFVPGMKKYFLDRLWTQEPMSAETPQSDTPKWCNHDPTCRSEQNHRRKLNAERGEEVPT